jgi:formate dehydrogenase major subunit
MVFSEETFETTLPGVFTGGDMATGPAVAIDAIAHGKMAANAIDRYVLSGKAAGKAKEFISRKEAFGEIPESDFAALAKIAKEKMPELPAASRAATFDEVELGFRREQAQNESSRCLECGCSAYFDCELRQHAVDFGVDISKFVGETRKYKVDKAHPFILLDPNKCIACGRCVRTCSEILRVSALGFVYRGFKSVVRPSQEKKLLETNCISCGNCIAACPTGAIAENLPFAKPGPWAGKKHETICHFCSVGCVLHYKVFLPDAYAVTGTASGAHNKGYLCHKGRFGYRYLLDERRLRKPLVKAKKQLQEASWDQALAKAAKGIQAVIKKHGPASVAICASPRLANEELYLLRKWAQEKLQANAIGSFALQLNPADRGALDAMLGLTTSTTTMDELRNADAILVVNAELTRDNLIVELKIKEAMKQGARLVSVSSSENSLSRIADLWLDPKRGTNTALFAGLANALADAGKLDRSFIDGRTEGFEAYRSSIAAMNVQRTLTATGVQDERFQRAVEILTQAANVVVVYGMDQCLERARDDVKALGNLLLQLGKIGQPGNGLLLVRDYANSQGLSDMGFDQAPGELLAKLKKNKIKALLAFGEDPLDSPEGEKLLAGVEFRVVADFFLTATAESADVVLPMSSPLESSGTYTACDRRVQRSPAIVPPPAGKTNLEIIAELAEKLDMALKPQKPEELFKEIGEVVRHYRGVETGASWGKDLFREGFPTSSGKAAFLPLQIDLTPCNQERRSILASDSYLRLNIQGKLMV